MERSPVEPMSPLLAAELFEQGRIHPHDRPMLAAQWLTEGRGGEALVELASLRGAEPEVSDLWPAALAELGIPLQTTPRAAMAWAAQQVVEGKRDTRWLVRTLWTEFDAFDEQDDFQRLILLLDDTLDWTDRDLRSRDPETRETAQLARDRLQAAIELMARDDEGAALAHLRRSGA